MFVQVNQLLQKIKGAKNISFYFNLKSFSIYVKSQFLKEVGIPITKIKRENVKNKKINKVKC